MDLTMSIASASMTLSEFKTQQALDVTMMRKVMDLQEVQALSLIESIPEMPNVPDPTGMTGRMIDVRV